MTLEMIYDQSQQKYWPGNELMTPGSEIALTTDYATGPSHFGVPI